MKELVYVFKTMLKFLITDPKERTDQEREDIFIVGEAIRQTKELSDRRRKRKRIYGTGRMRSKIRCR